jgi:hypothetical protein
MGMMMLYACFLDSIQGISILGGQVLRMQVMGDNLVIHVKHPSKVLNPLFKGIKSLDVLQISNMIA